MYPLVNPLPKFLVGDVCKVIGYNGFVLITEINCNTGQTEDYHQWSFAIRSLTDCITKVAWYRMDELEFVKSYVDEQLYQDFPGKIRFTKRRVNPEFELEDVK